MIKLSLLIPTIQRDAKLLPNLLSQIDSQAKLYPNEVEVVIDTSEQDSVGAKRNRLLQDAKGEYMAFIDSDDEIADNYIDLIMKAVDAKPDCVSLKGIITTDGKNPLVFEHSLKYDAWKTNEVSNPIRYFRFPNHLNTIKTSIAKQIKFAEKNHGEDFEWSTELHYSGLLNTEYYIDQVIYFYKFISNK